LRIKFQLFLRWPSPQLFRLKHLPFTGVKAREYLSGGVEGENFSKATGLFVAVSPGEIVVGEELARQLNLKVGDEMALTLGKGNDAQGALPGVKVFKLRGVVKHGIYQKDLRLVYLDRNDLGSFLV
jgi:ABC-type lipoprotein release transport system permease subunit